MRIPSGKTDQLIYFVAVDATDLVTKKTGLTTFTAYRSRNGGAAVAYTTPTIAEVDATHMPGVYSMAVDEDTTVAGTSDSEEYCLFITQAAMAPVVRTIELYRRDTTSNRQLLVDASGRVDVAAVAGTAQTAGDVNANLATIAGYIDTEVGAIKAKTDLIPASPTAVSDIPTANQNADALLDRANGVETGWTLRQVMRIIISVLAGKSTGHPGSPIYRSITDAKDRVTATVVSGNRSAVTADAT